MTKITAIALALILVGCVTVPVADNPREIWCDTNKPRPPLENSDTASRAVIDDYNNYQDNGIAWCGWEVQ
jgi:hypothetical protein